MLPTITIRANFAQKNVQLESSTRVRLSIILAALFLRRYKTIIPTKQTEEIISPGTVVSGGYFLTNLSTEPAIMSRERNKNENPVILIPFLSLFMMLSLSIILLAKTFSEPSRIRTKEAVNISIID